MGQTDYRKPDVKAVLFVGGKKKNLPTLKDDIVRHHWEQDGRNHSLSPPIPDIVVVLYEHCEHEDFDQAKTYAQGLKIPCLKVSGGKAGILRSGVLNKLDLRHLFKDLDDLELPDDAKPDDIDSLTTNPDKKKGKKKAKKDRKRNRKIMGEYANKIRDRIVDFGYEYPISLGEAQHIVNMIALEMEETANVHQIKKFVKKLYQDGFNFKRAPMAESEGSKSEAPAPGGSLDRDAAPAEAGETMEPEGSQELTEETEKDRDLRGQQASGGGYKIKEIKDQKPGEKADISERTVAIFENLFSMHDKILELTQENTDLWAMNDKLEKEVRALREQVEKQQKMIDLIEQIKAS